MNRVLLVIETEAPPESIWAKVTPAIPAGATVAVLAFTDEPLPALEEALAAFTVERLPAAALLLQENDTFSASVREWLAPLARACADIEGWQATRLFEWNYAHPEWFSSMRLACLDRLLASDGFDAGILVAPPLAATVARRQAANRGHALTVVEDNGPRARTPWWRPWLRRLYDAWTEGAVLRASRHASQPTAARVLAYATYPSNWSVNGSSGVYRYLGNRLPHLIDGFAYLITVSRLQVRRLRPRADAMRSLNDLPPPGLDNKVAIVETFGCWRDILSCYLNPLPTLRFLAAIRRASQCQRPFAPLFAETIRQSAVNDLPRSRYLGRCVARATRQLGATVLLASTYELAEGRAAMIGAHRAGARVVAQQHGSHHAHHYWRSVDSLALVAKVTADNAACPDLLLVEGEADTARAAVLPCPVQAVGALRLAEMVAPPADHPVSKRVLVLGELHGAARLALRCIDLLDGSGFTVVLRPHPRSADVVRNAISRHRPDATLEWSDPSQPLDQELRRLTPLAVLTGVTGAALDVALECWPLAIIPSNRTPLRSPLAVGGPMFEGTDATTLCHWLSQLHDDDAMRQEVARQCRRNAERLLAATGDRAADLAMACLEAHGLCAPASNEQP